ncbi:MAG TPA: hypothetical protein VFM79_01750 [Pelobium sp.]|nr:hypothetical protein [Pelobium sp.]
MIPNLEYLKSVRRHLHQYPEVSGEEKQFKGCLFGLGAGENHAALHHPNYDFPDEIIEAGIKIFNGIIQQKTKT